MIKKTYTKDVIKIIRRIAMNSTSLIITIIGAINWLLVGLFKFDLVAALFGGQTSLISRIVYIVVGLAGLWCITFLFRDKAPNGQHSNA